MICQDCNTVITPHASYTVDAGGGHHMYKCAPCTDARPTEEAWSVAEHLATHATDLGIEPTERQAILDEAREIISVDRNGSYGEPEANQARIAALWSVYLETPITPRQAAICLVLVKIAREIHAPKRDNLVDIAGYAAVAGEL